VINVKNEKKQQKENYTNMLHTGFLTCFLSLAMLIISTISLGEMVFVSIMLSIFWIGISLLILSCLLLLIGAFGKIKNR